MIYQALKLLFAIFPVPFVLFLLGSILIFVIIATFKLVKLVLDAIPFL